MTITLSESDILFPVYFSAASIRKFDKYSVTGVHFFTLNRYPCAPIYEYSKCKLKTLTFTRKVDI